MGGKWLVSERTKLCFVLNPLGKEHSPSEAPVDEHMSPHDNFSHGSSLFHQRTHSSASPVPSSVLPTAWQGGCPGFTHLLGPLRDHSHQGCTRHLPNITDADDICCPQPGPSHDKERVNPHSLGGVSFRWINPRQVSVPTAGPNSLATIERQTKENC